VSAAIQKPRARVRTRRRRVPTLAVARCADAACVPCHLRERVAVMEWVARHPRGVLAAWGDDVVAWMEA
jgi:hypothetical protein